MTEESSGTYEGRLSEFNSNKASLMRIDTLMKSCHSGLMSGDYGFFYRSVQSLKIEARYKMPKDSDDRKECDRLFNMLRQKFLLWENNKGNTTLRIDMEKSIEEFLEFLTDFMGDKGMLLRDADEEDYL